MKRENKENDENIPEEYLALLAISMLAFLIVGLLDEMGNSETTLNLPALLRKCYEKVMMFF
jgi:hypothetical protein